MIYTGLGRKDLLEALAMKAESLENYNISFISYFTLGDVDKCLETLIKSERLPEAAFFAKTYSPSKISNIVQLWKQWLQKEHKITSQQIADPWDCSEFVEDLTLCVRLEKIARKRRAELDVPAHQYNELKEFLSADLFTVLKENKDMDLELIESEFEVVVENPLIEKLWT